MAEDTTSGSGLTGGIADWLPRIPSESDPAVWRLDVVTLLAVIGESAMAEHSQTITASFLCLLPRILPAPQALLKPSRPPRMPETPAKMAGVYSGIVLDTVGFFASIIQPLDELPAFAFKAIEVRHRTTGKRGRPLAETARRAGTPALDTTFGADDDKRREGGAGDGGNIAQTTGAANGVAFDVDPEHGGQMPQPGIKRRRTMQQKAADFVTTLSEDKRPAVPVQLWSPVHVLSVFSCILTAAMIAMACHWGDGAAIFAVSLVSLASSIVGWASWWEPILMNLSHSNELPPGDIVIRTREGAFVYVKCHEGVTRELFSGTEECRYRVGDNLYRLLMGLGTMMLMISVVLLGNCSWNMQLFVGAVYISLNALYWAMGMLPKHYFWDLSRYEWEDITPDDAKNANLPTAAGQGDASEAKPSFTRTLWYAIRETKRAGWVERSGAAPGTHHWHEWLKEAQINANSNNRAWPAVARKDAIMVLKKGLDFLAPESPLADAAAQRAPLSEVQGRRSSVVPIGTL